MKKILCILGVLLFAGTAYGQGSWGKPKHDDSTVHVLNGSPWLYLGIPMNVVCDTCFAWQMQDDPNVTSWMNDNRPMRLCFIAGKRLRNSDSVYRAQIHVRDSSDNATRIEERKEREREEQERKSTERRGYEIQSDGTRIYFHLPK
jgi:hypothetical protein